MKAGRAAQLWRKQMMIHPLEEATHWLELLIGYGDLKHLKMSDNNLNFWQYFCIDIIFFLAFSLMIMLILCTLLCSMLKRKLVKKEGMPNKKDD